MRPVNLIPPEERRDGSAQMRGGPLAYIIVGALALLLIGVVLLVDTGNQASAEKDEIASLESQVAATEAKAQRLTAYTNLAELHDRRVATVTSLATSRFDWERVIRELSLILPDSVWLTNLTGTARPDVSVEGAASVALRDSAQGPALEMLGCARSQDAVAGFISELKEIEGVTRVAVQASKLDPGAEGGGGEAEGEVSVGNCQTRNFIAQFEIVAAFDSVPTATGATE
jgi:type IV pilus assembly protein PilN